MAETKEKKNPVKPETDKFAVIRTGGKQYIVKEGDVIDVELLEVEDGADIVLETLLIADGDKVEIGTPILEKANVSAVSGGEVKGDKKIVFKYKKEKEL